MSNKPILSLSAFLNGLKKNQFLIHKRYARIVEFSIRSLYTHTTQFSENIIILIGKRYIKNLSLRDINALYFDLQQVSLIS